jgi:hypothetical protein
LDVLEGRCDRKVVGGKLFRIKVILERDGQDCTMKQLTILGDFFMHPEESIEGLEEAVRMAYNNDQNLNVAILIYVAQNAVTLYGGSSVDLSSAVLDAVDDALSQKRGD